MKHLVLNKIRLKGQREHFDRKPEEIIIIPILTREEVKDWNGGSYSAIVVAGRFVEGPNTDYTRIARPNDRVALKGI